MKFGLLAIGTFLLRSGDEVEAAFRGQNNKKKDEQKHIRQLMMTDGGGGGHGGCPYFVKGWPSGTVGCCSNDACTVAGEYCLQYPGLDAQYGYTGFCGPELSECYTGLVRMPDEGVPNPGGACGVAPAQAQGEIIDIQANDVDIQIYRNNDGDEVVKIASASSAAKPQEEPKSNTIVSSYATYEMASSSSIHVMSDKKTSADCEGSEIYVRFDYLADDEFDDYGQVYFQEVDEDDSSSIYDEDDFDSGDEDWYGWCVERVDKCYTFSVSGADQAFTLGYARLNVDYRNGHNKRLMCLGATGGEGCEAGTFGIERVAFGCHCDPDHVATSNPYVGGCTPAELERADALADDDDDDDDDDSD